MSQPNCDITLAYNLLVVGDSDAGVRGAVSAYMDQTTTSDVAASFLRPSQKLMRLTDNRVLVLDIIERPGDIFQECSGDLARSHGILLVYNPTSLSSFEHVVQFYEQKLKSKWKSLPVVLFLNTSTRRGAGSVQVSHVLDFAKKHAIPFVNGSHSHLHPAPFSTLLSLVRQHYEAPAALSFGEGVVDLLTVAAAKVSHVARSHFPALPLTAKESAQYPPRTHRHDFTRSPSAPRSMPKFRH
ncbi:hypothetical protein BC826DRAFT_1109190 [Russula brevipes]|nr:hypothetical protein BC826DRAFT_1109190 [Russula brevipes]